MRRWSGLPAHREQARDKKVTGLFWSARVIQRNDLTGVIEPASTESSHSPDSRLRRYAGTNHTPRKSRIKKFGALARDQQLQMFDKTLKNIPEREGLDESLTVTE